MASLVSLQGHSCIQGQSAPRSRIDLVYLTGAIGAEYVCGTPAGFEPQIPGKVVVKSPRIADIISELTICNRLDALTCDVFRVFLGMPFAKLLSEVFFVS